MIVMKIKNKYLMILSIVLSLLFSIALFISTIVLPSTINKLLINLFPDYMIYFNWEEALRFVNTIRPLGYISLIIIIALIILGFLLRKFNFSFLGSIMLYLPTFSYFASSMFILAGIGVLRALWIPIIDLSPGATFFEKIYNTKYILELGNIVYLPYDILRIIIFAFIMIITKNIINIGMIIDIVLFFIILLFGITIFFISCSNWLYGKFINSDIITWGIYKYSRHPQYLGFLIWTYALLIYDKYIFSPVRGGYFPSPSIIWLIVMITIIAVALSEEMKMIKIYGNKYKKYINKTSFLIPLPKKILIIFVNFNRKIIKKDRPENLNDIFKILMIYYFILILLSIMYNLCLKIY
jgi:protein-S-isoprenylcysteine O-methyltransferase Ste14